MKRIIFIIAIGLLSLNAFSQEAVKYEQPKHEISLWGGYGLSTFNYDLNKGDRDEWGLGYLGGIGYTYFFNYHWGLGIGAEFAALKSELDLGKSFTDAYHAPAFAGADRLLYLEATATNYEETYEAFYINVPVMLKYQVDVWKQHKLYLSGGLKVGIPFQAKHSATGTITPRAWDIDGSGNKMGDVISGVHGFGTPHNVNVDKREFDLKLNYALALEAGMKWKLSNKFALYTGLFLDYGLTDVRDANLDQRFADFKEGSAPTYIYTPTTNQVWNSEYGVNGNAFTDKVSTLAAGLKVQLSFGFGPKNARKMKPVPVEKPFEGVTPDQMEQMLGRNADKIIDAVDRNFDELYKHLEKECPELFEPLPTDELESIVQFDFDKDLVKNLYFPDIDRKIAIMKKYPEAKLTLIGHTDNRGTDAYNYNLGMERAQAVKSYMVAKGIDANRLFVESKGKTQPIYPNTTDDNRYRNRRVEFQLRP